MMFPTVDVLGCTSGVLCGAIGGIYEVLGYVLGDDLMTHQLPAASRAAEAGLIAQHPWLVDCKPPTGDLDALMAFLARVTAEHGAMLDLEPIADAPWKAHNAIADAVDIFGDRLIVIDGGTP